MSLLLNNAANITPAQGVLGSFWGCIVSPDLPSYMIANGVVPANIEYNGGGTPIAVPVWRGIKTFNWIVNQGSGITAGAILLYALMLDGNWHQIGSGITLTANGNSWGGSGPGVVTTTGISQPAPWLGLAWKVSTALVGGNINYVELKGLSDLVESTWRQR